MMPTSKLRRRATRVGHSATSVRRPWTQPLARIFAASGVLAMVLLLWPGAGSAQDAQDVRRSSAQPQGLGTNVPQTYALTGADIVVKPGEVVQGGTLVVRDGKILAVGKDVQIPADAQRIELSGKRIYAGFIDAYAELPAEQSARDPALAEASGAANYWNSNVTPQISASRILAIDARAHEALRKAGIVARLYAPSAGIIKGRAALVSTAEGINGDRAVLADDVALVAQLRPLGRGFGSGYPSSPMGAFALVRQALYDAVWYQQAQQAVSDDATLPLPERNDALAALQPVLAGEVPVFFRNPDEKYALRADKVAEEFKLKAVHVGSGYEYRRADLVSAGERPMILPLSFPRPPDVSTPEQADAATLEGLMHWDLAPDNPKRMQAAGVKIAFSTEGLRRVESEFLGNLRRAIQRGLPADAALQALTTNAAEILGVSDRLGTLERGKLASFVIADGDLFAERSRARITETWVDGRRHVVVRQPVTDFRGTWELRLAEGRPVQVRIAGTTPERLSGNVVSPTTRPSTRPTTRPEADTAEGRSREDQPPSERPQRRPRAEADQVGAADQYEMDSGAELTSGQDAERQEQDAQQPDQPARRPGQGQGRREAQEGEEPGGRGEPVARGEFASQGSRSGGPGALRNLRQSGDRVSFTTDARPFGQRGVVLVSLTRVAESVTGTLILPDGRRVPVTARLTAGPETRPTTRPDGERIEATAPEEGDPPVQAAEGEPTEAQQRPDRGYLGGTTRTTESDESEGQARTEIERVPATGPGAEARNKPLFEPNYPMGAFGRDSAEPPASQIVVLTNATVWTSGPQGRLEKGYVVIQDGKIAAVGEGGPQDLPRGATEIDCSGKHISPGIIDCHSHIASDSGINEGSQAITCEVRLQDYVNPDDINIYRQLAGGTTLANTLHGSANPIGGQNVVIKFRWGQGPEQMIMAEAPKGVKFALGENVKRSGGGGRGGAQSEGRYPGSRMGVPEIVADAFRRAQDYQRARASFEKNGGLPVRTDLELEALVEMLNGDRLIHCHSYRQDEILAMLRVLETFGIRMASLQHILEGYKVAREIAEHGATASTFSDWWAYKMEVYDAIPYNGAIMHNADIIVSFNSDDAELARRLNTEAAKAVKYGGVPEEEALKFVTINPARQLQIDKYVGSLEVGKHADLVIWSGPPLSTRSRAEQTWIDGRKYFDREEDLKQREKVREMRAALIQRILSSGEQPAGPGETPVRESDLWPSHDIYCGHGHTIEELLAAEATTHEGHDHE